MNPRNLHIVQENSSNRESDDESIFESIDFDKIFQVAKKSIPWIIILFALTLSLSYLYLRYTKPLYSSESILKLDIKSEAGLLGISNPLEKDIKGISGEIEILRSKLFLSQVVDEVNMEVSYFHPGRSHLVDERYGNSPFHVKVDMVNGSLRDSKFEVKILNDDEFTLTYRGGSTERYKFGEKITNEHFEITLHKTSHFDSQKGLIDFYFVINSRESLIRYFQNNIIIEPINWNANTIKIALTDHNQYKAKALVTAIDTLYLEYTKNAKNQAGQQKIAFLEKQMKTTAAKLEEYEAYFEKFTIEHRTTNLSQDLEKTIILLNELDSQRFNIRTQLTTIDLVAEQIKNGETLVITNKPATASEHIKNYNDLVRERELKIENYNENTQVIQRLDLRIDVAKKAALRVLDATRVNLLKSQEDIEQKRTALENNFVELPSMGTSYNKTRRMYSLQEEFYFSLIKSKMELEIAKAGTVTNFVILSPASFPSVPIHPKKMIIYGLGGVAGLVLSLVFLAVSYLMHDKVTSQKELEKLISAPILGVVPRYNIEKLETTRMVVDQNPKSSISESLRSIRTNMDFIAADQKNRVVSITSTVSGEGKTFIAVNLGAICAYSGQKVVIVDLDMRKPKVHLAFQTDKSDKGVSTVLIGRHELQDCIQSSEVENLSYIQAGPTPPNPSELIMSDHFGGLMEELKSMFDVIILDTPPVGLVTDGVLVMKKSDLPIYVVRADYSRKAYAKSIQRLISSHRFNHLTVILNAVRASGEYGYGYGYGYAYGEEYYDHEKPSFMARYLKRS